MNFFFKLVNQISFAYKLFKLLPFIEFSNRVFNSFCHFLPIFFNSYKKSIMNFSRFVPDLSGKMNFYLDSLYSNCCNQDWQLMIRKKMIWMIRLHNWDLNSFVMWFYHKQVRKQNDCLKKIKAKFWFHYLKIKFFLL